MLNLYLDTSNLYSTTNKTFDFLSKEKIKGMERS